jgi:hypothetical protein
MQKACPGRFSEATLKLIREDPTAKDREHLCDVCGKKVMVDHEWEQWLPAHHYPPPQTKSKPYRSGKR